jgi:transcriptional regulator with XRE-family HTH domain
MPPRPRAAKTRHRTKPDPFAKAVGARVRRLRKERDFTFDAFVEETGLGRGYISELERGLVVPTITALAKVAAALELTVADLVLGDSARERLFEAARALDETQVSGLLKQAEALVAST